jgi:hypothetical protein
MSSRGIPDRIFSNVEFDRRAEVDHILTHHYPQAKEAILMLEIYSGKRSTRAVYELRDTLDHLSVALDLRTSPADARRHIAECHTHLRRAAVEPYEWLAERQFLKIEKIVTKGKWLYRILFLEAPSGSDLMVELREIGMLIREGRIAKGSGESLKHMKEASLKADDLLDRLKPKQLNDRFFDLVLATVTLVLGAILGVVATELYHHWYG